MPWLKGNLHCHSTNSDGHASPEGVAAYYRSIGMDFVTISDHNRLTSPAEYVAALSEDQAAIPCCEYTGAKSCHVVAVDVERAVSPEAGQNDRLPIEILQDGVDRTREAGGVPVLCHPCWNWAYDDSDILQLTDVSHFEVFNAAPDCNSYPVAGRSAPEEIWDRVLSAGHWMYGVATDDAHWYDNGETIGKPPTVGSLGGKGWCVVWAEELSRAAIRSSFEAGRFYASTGVELTDYRVSEGGMSVAARLWCDQRVVVEFIGAGGEVLAREYAATAFYRFRGDEGYVRARILDSSGGIALTQPVFTRSIEDEISWTSVAARR